MALGSPLAAVSLVDQAFEQLADAIAIGDLKPGERIREAFLAREMGISRGVLREAVHRLEGRKLVRRTSNIGVHVVSLTEHDLSELFAMREALEGLAARLAAQHMTTAEIGKLKRLLD
jgi:DNA-binding GntR family transcriptional regulator